MDKRLASRCLALAVLALLLPFLPQRAGAQTSNVAYQDTAVRITVIADGAVRLEYAPGGKFTDAKSQLAVCRTYAPVSYRVKAQGKSVRITTPCFILDYKKGTGRFTAQNLRITSAPKASPAFSWHPGMKDTLNLKGTYGTLDHTDGSIDISVNKPIPIEDGLLSRSGWTLIDDSQTYLFDGATDWEWVTERPQEGGQDLYFLAYGRNYKQALLDFTKFAGKIPLPPRYAFGYWWSRYWAYSDNELRDLVDRFHRYDIPLDVLVVDMDWHYSREGLGSWTGYTWNRRLFPDPAGFVGWAKKQNLKVTLNLHPAEGIRPFEETYPQMARRMGLNPADKKDIPWAASDKRFMRGWFETQLRPMENWGVSFWWPDWQQQPFDPRLSRLNQRWWLNYCLFSDMERTYTDRRPMLYHRWGGLGNHRYQIGFSGDARTSWASLDYQVWFNATASNVLYGYWSHDIGGHWNPKSLDPELYVRWMQFGLYSPILRTHSSKAVFMNKEPWVFSAGINDQLHDIIRRRYALAPYIYTMARTAHDSALSICRPLYYDYPDRPEAYDRKTQYLFGSQMLIHPVTAPADSGVAVQETWLPEGTDWFETSSGTLLKGGQTDRRTFHLDETPVYVKAGSIIPTYGHVDNLQRTDEDIILEVYPGGTGCEFQLYEDNGDDQYYPTRYAVTPLSAKRSGQTLNVSIGARKGQYDGMPSQRRFSLKVVASAVPERVEVDGKEAPFTYDGNTLSLLIPIANTLCAAPKEVSITYPADAPDVVDGLTGQFRRIQQNVLNYKRKNAGLHVSEALGTMESCGRAVTYRPEELRKRVETFRRNFQNLPAVLQDNGLSERDAADFLRMTR